MKKIAESFSSKVTIESDALNAPKDHRGIKAEDLDKETPEMLERRRIALKRARDFI
jgi:hypothetical protein